MEFYLRKDTYSRAVMQASVRQETFFCVSLDGLTIAYYLLSYPIRVYYLLPYNLC